jgi:AGCS family alanine or glycine:cation symporter
MEINDLITSVNDVIWGDCLIYVLIACGLWFTWRTRFMQFRMIGEMFRLLTDAAVDTAGAKKQEENKTKKNISSFQAFKLWQG